MKLEHLLCPKVGGGGTNPLVPPPPTFESGGARAPPPPCPPSPTPLVRPLCRASNLWDYVQYKSDIPLYIDQTHAVYFDTAPYNWSDNVNTKSV